MTPAACILGLSGPRLSASEAAFFRAANPWGFILFARNVETPAQLRALCADLRGVLGRAAPILVDQEGGRVQRLGPPRWTGWPAPLDHAARARDPLRALYLRGLVIGTELRRSGIDVNCAPCADLAGPETHPFLRNRCLGQSAPEVAARARALAQGLLAAGVLPVIKHIPGHGRATADSHRALPVADAPRATLEQTDFAAFRLLADLPLGMTAHLLYPALDDRQPATLSAGVIAAIRGSIGFDGLLMTDDLSMGALSGGLPGRVTGALAAGCDVALHCNGALPEMEQVVAAAGPLGAAAMRRAARALALRRAPLPHDPAAALAELRALGGMEGTGDDG